MDKSLRIVSILLIAVFAVQLVLWNQTRHMKPRWFNVPPAPKVATSASLTLGDSQLAYRAYGVTFQNMGDQGGDVTPLRDLDYGELSKWFDVMDHLDPKSSFVPMLVSYYYSATDNKQQLDYVIEYLRKIGLRDAADHKKWRWLVNAIFLARHKQKDLDKALALSYELSNLQNQGIELPSWAKNMPSFIKMEQGDKQGAYEMTIRLLQEGAEDMHPNEVNFMVDYLCTRILSKEEASIHPLCQDTK